MKGMSRSEVTHEPRATPVDWTKAFTCSALFVILLLLLFFRFGSLEETVPSSASVSRAGEGDSATAGDGGDGGIGDGIGTGIGDGEGTGSGTEGEGPGGGPSGDGSGRVETGEAPPGAGIVADPAAPVTGNGAAVEVAETAPAEEPTTSEVEEKAEEEEETESELPPPPMEDKIASLSLTPVAAAPPPSPAGLASRTGASGRSGGDSGGKNVGGMLVKGNSLGVILDVSGSMTPYLEELRKEIREKFADAVFLEVRGCSLHPTNGAEIPVPDASMGPGRDSVMLAIRELVEVHRVDSVYWFSDLQDSQSEDALHELMQLVAGTTLSREAERPGATEEFSGLDELEKLQEGRPVENPDSVFRLYVRSTDQRPESELARIIRKSGGSFQKKG